MGCDTRWVAVSEQEELDQLAQRFLTLAGAEFQSLPLYDALARGMAIRPDLLRHLLAARPGQRRPNLMLAALHDLALRNPESDCGLLFPTCGGSVGAVGQQGTRIDPVRAAADLIDAHTEDFEGLIATRSIQTNEPNRSALWMLASRWAAADLPKVPVSVVELGASGGINLLFDHYHCQFGQDYLGDPAASVRLSCELSGNAPSLLSLPAPDIASRVGIDITPVDLSDPNERRWLKACVWAEQTLRHERFDAAADAVSRTPPKVVRDDLVDGLSDLIDDLPHDSHLLVLNSWVLTYVERSRRAALLPILSLAAKDRPVTWVSAEAQGVVEWVPTPDSFDTQAEHLAESRGDTVIGVSTWRNGVQSVALGGHCHGHCAWVDWKLDAPLGEPPSSDLTRH